MPENLAALHATVWGRVQGVLFRDFVREHAERLGLTGWVRNLPNGSVEVWVEGERDKLEQLARYLKIGPPAATVARVITEWSEYTRKYSDFKIRC